MILNFRCQGAMVSSIKPEYLLDKSDFVKWAFIRDAEMADSGVRFSAESLEKERQQYDLLSRHAWVDVLLQIFKVCGEFHSDHSK